MSRSVETLDSRHRSEPDTGPLLAVQDLVISFGSERDRVRVVDGLSFDIYPGETVAVLGESGSGKSVTAQAITGLLPQPVGHVDGGRILYRDVDLLKRPLAYTRALSGTQIAMIFQDPLSSLNPVMRVGAQIGEAMRRRSGVSRREARERAIELMERVGIPAARRRIDDYPHQFSGGMRQRVMIAIALASDPKVLIADEATTALDVTTQAQIMELLVDLRQRLGTAVIMISHDLSLAASYADEVLVMYAGKVVEQAATERLFANVRMPYTRALLDAIPQMSSPAHTLLSVIGGHPPDPSEQIQGCPFRPRCHRSSEVCASAPTLDEHDPGHWYACWNPVSGREPATRPTASTETFSGKDSSS